jgi:hypothetical protein
MVPLQTGQYSANVRTAKVSGRVVGQPETIVRCNLDG